MAGNKSKAIVKKSSSAATTRSKELYPNIEREFEVGNRTLASWSLVNSLSFRLLELSLKRPANLKL